MGVRAFFFLLAKIMALRSDSGILPVRYPFSHCSSEEGLEPPHSPSVPPSRNSFPEKDEKDQKALEEPGPNKG